MNSQEVENALFNLDTNVRLKIIKKVLRRSGVNATYFTDSVKSNLAKNEAYILSQQVLAKDWNTEADERWDNYEENEQETF